MSRSVEAVSRRCRLTLTGVNRVKVCQSYRDGPVSERQRADRQVLCARCVKESKCQSVDCVECRSVERVGACRSVSSVSSVSDGADLDQNGPRPDEPDSPSEI